MNSIKIKRYKKHIMELKFLRSELSYQEEVLNIAHQDFEIWHREWCQKNDIDLAELNQKHENRVSKIISQPNFSDLEFDEAGILVLNKEDQTQEKQKFQKLFKQVAKATHPDKHKGTMLDFKAASAAFENGDWAMLLQIAEQYGIMPEDLAEVLPVMKEEAERLKKTIEHNKETYSWRLYECESEQCKENLVKQFLKQLFNLEL
tara:strand:+ start:233 stop:844 length:612 start_codon:yes stop_codon:yes gene_type:complete